MLIYIRINVFKSFLFKCGPFKKIFIEFVIPPALEGEVSTTGPLGKSQNYVFNDIKSLILKFAMSIDVGDDGDMLLQLFSYTFHFFHVYFLFNFS